MTAFYGVLIGGIVLTIFGICIWKNPDLIWDLSLTRQWYIKGGEPTGVYYFNQRVRAIASIFFGVVLIIVSTSMAVTKVRGYVVEIDGNELKIPCTYSDIEALGYKIDPSYEIKTLRAKDKNGSTTYGYIARDAEGKEIHIFIENRSNKDRLLTKCEVVSVKVYIENGPNIELPNGVKNGMSEREVKSIMVQSSCVNNSEVAYYDTKGFEKYLIRVAFDGDLGSKKMTWIEVKTNY